MNKLLEHITNIMLGLLYAYNTPSLVLLAIYTMINQTNDRKPENPFAERPSKKIVIGNLIISTVISTGLWIVIGLIAQYLYPNQSD